MRDALPEAGLQQAGTQILDDLRSALPADLRDALPSDDLDALLEDAINEVTVSLHGSMQGMDAT
jgi:hypothetical protein